MSKIKLPKIPTWLLEARYRGDVRLYSSYKHEELVSIRVRNLQHSMGGNAIVRFDLLVEDANNANYNSKPYVMKVETFVRNFILFEHSKHSWSEIP